MCLYTVLWRKCPARRARNWVLIVALPLLCYCMIFLIPSLSFLICQIRIVACLLSQFGRVSSASPSRWDDCSSRLEWQGFAAVQGRGQLSLESWNYLFSRIFTDNALSHLFENSALHLVVA